ncbi:MAG: bifunctional UDP-N-acetylglucosamine diphosphorylase/glucosamine-1-phosphate N-acetyltransferase GlmU [Ruminococcus sp.]|uniref:bifunctional UDP-N-acetylglucosamine diphosphorylase/glucosamine-1-phosphate N-acetyltransferase GlmU n=1 Tax=Ruminococcus sp. TaxID=41978 RepID=UPI0025F48548|nr:bifunctional UDP-N-acetylglucosamine diphosphorylase/glucosamine-1-phosphate N-acetyltransferase GlmU [Ruminococcus sp.]MCR5599700.1 bifunctional UDP-N-acetylglucosamine diphosphorylase/glucosamine-1-phosphate N-acetyltransferase GlmU [Ruminococcus sp.]
MNKAVILAGGQGKRMKAEMPKPLFKVLGEPMLHWVISACEAAELTDICVVKGFKGEMIDEYLDGKYTTVLQAERLGTGHAVQQAIPFLENDTTGNTLVLCGDAPFIDEATIRESLVIHKQQNNAVTVITAELDEPFGYGRIIRSAGGISGIVEQKDATDEQKLIKEVNSGAYWFRTADLIDLLGKLKNDNAQNEYYLTDTIAIALSEGRNAGAYKSDNADIIKGANDRKDLLELNTYARMAVIEKHLANGVEFTCIDGVVIERDVEIGVGTEILPNTILRKKTVIGKNCKIGPNTVVENCKIGDDVNLHTVQAYEAEIEAGVKIGPYVHIRPDSVIKSGAKIGDFVEIKNSTIGEKTAIAHLAYVGDSDVGKRVNIGCGTVTVNYDGIAKSRCVIGDNCFVGCNTNLIAPVKLGKAVYTAAGTTVTRDVPDYALAIDRGVMKVNEGYTLRKLKSKLGK